MKFIIPLIIIVTSTVLSWAGDVDIPVLACAADTTNSATTVQSLDDCYVNAVIVAAPTAWTGQVVVATTYYGTIFTTPAGITETNMYIGPRLAVTDTAGVSLASTNAYEEIFLCNDVLTATVTSSSSSTNDVSVKVRLRKP